MGFKNVCLSCKRVDNLGTDFNDFKTGRCPICNNKIFFVDHKFRPPKKTDKKGWDLAEYLITHGFIFQHVSDENGVSIKYPNDLMEAKEFVKIYRNQAVKKNE